MPGSLHHAQAPEPKPDTSCLSLEVVAPPRTETNEVLEELRAEKPQDTSWHLLLMGPHESLQAFPVLPCPMRNVGADARAPSDR